MGLNAASAEEHALRARFQEVCAQLQDRDGDDRFEKPLAFWTLASDRRLPYALLERSVGQVVRTSFEELFATPGIGHRKLSSLVMLLERVRADLSVPVVAEQECVATQPIDHEGRFDANLVSEQHWTDWCTTVRRHHLEDEQLGRVAPALSSLPTVIWRTQLKYYVQRSLDELRGLKTHGEKRVAVVLEAFHSLHQALGAVKVNGRLAIGVSPAFLPPVEVWLREAIGSDVPVNLQDLRQHVALPLLNQVHLDAGDIVHRLAAGRLGVESEPESVREQARRAGITRARVYQLLDTCGDVMDVRWPAGRWQLATLATALTNRPIEPEVRGYLAALQGLFYPARNTTQDALRRADVGELVTA